MEMLVSYIDDWKIPYALEFTSAGGELISNYKITKKPQTPPWIEHLYTKPDFSGSVLDQFQHMLGGTLKVLNLKHGGIILGHEKL